MNYEKKKRFIVNLIYCGLIALLVYVIITYGLAFLAPFLLAFLIAYALQIPTRYISRKTRLPHKPVALLLVLLFYSTVGLLAALLSIRIVTFTIDKASALPTVYSTEIEPVLSAIFFEIEQTLFKMDPALVAAIDDMFSQFVQSLGELVTNLSVQAVSILSGYATSLPGLFIRMILMIISTFFIALIISIFDILPVLGTGGIMLPWMILTALQGNYSLAIGLLVVYIVITIIRNILEPKIVGSQIGLHPIVTLASIFVGAQLFGVLGIFGFPILLSLLCHLNNTGTIHLFK